MKNLTHKVLSKDINILYNPSYTIFDTYIYDLPFNFYALRPPTIDSVLHPVDLSIFPYNFILTSELHNSLFDIAYKLHLPIVNYIHNDTVDTIEFNTFTTYIIENTDSSMKDVSQILKIFNPHFGVSVTDKQYDIGLLNTNPFSKIDNRIVDFFKEHAPGIQILESVQDLKRIGEFRFVVDLYPTNISNLIYCINSSTVYLSTPQKLFDSVNGMYKNLFLGKTTMDIIGYYKQNLPYYHIGMFGSDQTRTNLQEWSKTMIQYLSGLKNKGFVIK